MKFFKIYGLVSGKLPKDICVALNIFQGLQAIGIVMRYEGGGSLGQLLSDVMKNIVKISLEEKLRLLRDITRGLAELHSVGIVHADIKPDNVLLSFDDPPKVRLADFGLSHIAQEISLSQTTLTQTSHGRGSPIYCAPELLFNPFSPRDESVSMRNLIAKPSRKTDIYSFAVLAWEVLSGELPFDEAQNEIMLSTMVHQGQRPHLERLPKDCPRKVVELIDACWQTDRALRRSAVDCYTLLNHQLNQLSSVDQQYDVYMIHASSPYSILSSHIFHLFSQRDIKTYISIEEDDENEIIPQHLSLCKCIVIMVSRSFQEDRRFIDPLVTARSMRPSLRIIPLFLEADPLSWCNAELVYLCQLRTEGIKVYDLSNHLDSIVSVINESSGESLSPNPSLQSILVRLIDDISNIL